MMNYLTDALLFALSQPELSMDLLSALMQMLGIPAPTPLPKSPG